MRRMRTGKEEVRGDSNRSQNSRGSPPTQFWRSREPQMTEGGLGEEGAMLLER